MRLIVESLGCERGGRSLFRDLSLALDGGQALLVTGPNGVGKTSLLRVLAGLLAPVAGAVRLAGGDTELPLAEQCHFVGGREGLKASLTPREHLRHWTALLGGPAGPADPLEASALTAQADIPVAYLSAGQRRRLALARLLCVNRPLWLLDEPLNALDAASRDRFRRHCAAYLDRGGILVAATHDPIELPGARTLRLRPDAATPEPA